MGNTWAPNGPYGPLVAHEKPTWDPDILLAGPFSAGLFFKIGHFCQCLYMVSFIGEYFLSHPL